VRTLALETASQPGSLALLDGERLLADVRLPGQKSTAQALFPALQLMLKDAGWQPADVKLVAATSGPGSFTGLRIGMAFAKTWAYARDCQALGVATLDVLAAQAETEARMLWTVLDAQRGQLFAARYERANAGDEWDCVQPVAILDRRQWLEQLTDGCAVSGEGLTPLLPQLSSPATAQPRVVVVARACWSLSASTVGRLAQRRFLAGERSDFWRLRPQYYRKSAAEEKLEARTTPPAP
jgi:tRNA threonylcarbamoyladenosine biosynthesis protein TsaB